MLAMCRSITAHQFTHPVVMSYSDQPTGNT